MSPPLERDYIGLSDPPPTSQEEDEVLPELGFKATELKLGLPGSESPDRSLTVGLSLGLMTKSFVSGAKRGFSDVIDGSGKWSFAGGSGSDLDIGKNGGLFSPRGESNGGSGNGSKEGVGSDNKGLNDSTSPPGADRVVAPAAKAQVVGWPPIRSYRKNTLATNPSKNKVDTAEGKQGVGCLFIKVSMDGAPYLRKVDLRIYSNYKELSSELEKMFSCFTISQCGSHGGRDGLHESPLVDLVNGSEYVLTYEDKDGDWMLVGDVPWDMFADSCRRLRIMKGSDAIGLAPRSMEKCMSRK